MKKDFVALLEIARQNVKHNPSIVGKSLSEIAVRYQQGLLDEVKETGAELKADNQVHLTDELSDIAWDYAVLLAALEAGDWIVSADEVLEHAYQKYTERTPAFMVGSEELWTEIKNRQKLELAKRHRDKYGGN